MFGKITDKEKLQQIIDSKKASGDFEIYTGEELFKKNSNSWNLESVSIADCDWAGVYISYPTAKIDKESEYIIFESWDDIDEDPDGDTDYDVDYDDFSDSVIIDEMTSICVDEIECSYGAGRNG